MCASSQTTDQFGLCPSGQALTTIQAYVLDPSTQSYFDQVDQSFDYTTLASFFGFAFITVLMFWGVSKGIGSILRTIK
ncbi:hypothetical protein KTE53_08580 [Burkholderia multivorans]|nr:hypothetical protein [Burkholderia multivorans]